MRWLFRFFAFAIVLVLAALPNVQAQCVSLTTLGSAYTQDFDTLSNTADSTTNDLTITGWHLYEGGTSTRVNGQYAVDTGGSNEADTYSYGSIASTDRAMGGLQSDMQNSVIGACFTNNTGSVITSLDIAYVGEQWRIGNTAAARDDRLDFQYSQNAALLTHGTWTDTDALDFTNVVKTAVAVGALNGNLAANRANVASSISSLGIANGATFWIRWLPFDAVGADDGLAVDEFSLTPQGPPPIPNLSVLDASITEGDSGSSSLDVTIQLSAPALAGGVYLNIATADGTATANVDYLPRSTSVIIPEGDSTYSFRVTIIGDTTVEPDETFLVNVTVVTGALILDGQGEATIQNDDSPPDLAVADVAITEGGTGVTSTLNVTVQLSSPARLGGVTFDIWTSDDTATAGVDYVAAWAIGMYIPEGDLSLTFPITINGDALDEDNETFFVDVTGVRGATLVDGRAVATITDDDGPVNDPPVNTVPAGQNTPEDTSLSFSIFGGNQIQVSDVDADLLPVQVNLSVSSGTLLLASTAGITVFGDGTGTVTLSGTITAINGALDGLLYTPAPNWFGIADLSIVTNDLGNTGSGGPMTDTDFVSITVDSVNDAPVVTGLPLTGTEDTPIMLSGVAVDDVDAGGSVIRVTILNSLGVNLSVGTPGLVVVTGNNTPTVQLDGTTVQITAAINTISLVPPANFAGAAIVQISADDLGRTGSGGPMIGSLDLLIDFAPANDGPTLMLPGPLTTAETTPVALPGIVVSDVDSAGNPIVLTLTSTIGTLTLGGSAGVLVSGSGTGTLTMTGAVSDLAAAIATLIFTPPSAGGAGTITVTINDGGFTGGAPLSATNTFSVTVTDVNNAPILTTPGAQTTNEGIDLVFSTLNGNAISVSDVDAGTSDVQLTLTTSLGTMTLGSTAGLTSVVGNGSAAITLTGPIAAINAALQNLTLAVPAGVGGAGTISLTVSDLGNTGSGGTLTANGTISVTVNDVNDPPTLTVPGAQTTPEGTNLVFATANGNAISVTDIDAAGGNIRVTLTTTFGSLSLGSTAGLVVTGNGTAAITAEGPVASLNAALQGLTLTVSTTGEQTGTISIGVNDLGLTGSGGAQSAAAAVAVTVSGVNDAPTVVVPAAQITAEGVDLVFMAANGNSITVDDIDAGTGAIQVTLSTTAGTLSLGGVAGLTVAGNGTTTVTATGTIANLNTGLQGLTLSNALDTASTATITVVVSDLGLTGTGGVLTATGNIAVTITDVNDAPTIAAPPSQTTPEDVNLMFAAANGNAITIADADAGTGDVQVTLTTTIGTLTLSSAAGVVIVGNGTASVTATGTVSAINASLEGLILAVPAATSGTGTLTINVTDQGNTGTGGALTSTANVAITIDSINNPPVITITSLTQDGTSGFVTFSAGRGNGITISDPDADTSPIEITLTATCGTITLGSTAGLTFTAGDGTGDSTMTFTGTITSINAALEGMTFAVEPGCTGSAALVVSVNDLGATGTNGAQVATATINISAAAVAAVPTLSFFGLLALGLALIAAAGFRLK